MDDERQLEASFHQLMLNTYESAKRLKPPYNPTAFRRMVGEHGGRETANILLGGTNPSSGFAELFIRGKENLKLSVEYLVLQAPWRALFQPEQLAIARQRLLDFGAELPEELPEPEPEYWPLADELPSGTKLLEGAARSILVTAYERSPEARRRCLAHHGHACVVCGFDFGREYGAIAEGYIQVHHLVPLSTLKQSYEVDPIADLRPVCANCHAAIHLHGTCRSIEEVRALLAKRRLA